MASATRPARPKTKRPPPGRVTRRGAHGRLAMPRYMGFLAGILVLTPLAHLATPTTGWRDAATIAFDLSALGFLISLLPLLRDHIPAKIREHSIANDANRAVVLILTTLLTLVVLATISAEIPAAKKGEVVAVVKLVVTLLLTWTFANAVFTLHYAHSYYASAEDGGVGKDRMGIDFPGDDEPAYGDFAYFAFTLGMTFQTSDCQITHSRLRHAALLHSFLAFVFNIGVIAFTINMLGGAGG